MGRFPIGMVKREGVRLLETHYEDGHGKRSASTVSHWQAAPTALLWASGMTCGCAGKIITCRGGTSDGDCKSGAPSFMHGAWCMVHGAWCMVHGAWCMGANNLTREATQNLRGRCVLIVEDEHFLADDLAKGFAEAGIDILGPVPSLAKALELAEHKQIGGAVLDINLDGCKVYDVADALIERSVPVVFVTGYDKSDIPARFADVPFIQKPAELEDVIEALGRVAGK